jgi:hypothetical protein
LKLSIIISRTLWAVAILTIVLIISGGLWGALHGLHDRHGADAVKGVFLVAGTGWVLSFVTLVIATAVGQLRCLDSSSKETDS